mmetsp:Transcript_84947/g.214308  ORF Transcript_84947/g.214308 Transcript_84947/m.214308 type:complete len:88 (+) Transcript_84947:345-608(+)
MENVVWPSMTHVLLSEGLALQRVHLQILLRRRTPVFKLSVPLVVCGELPHMKGSPGQAAMLYMFRRCRQSQNLWACTQIEFTRELLV